MMQSHVREMERCSPVLNLFLEILHLWLHLNESALSTLDIFSIVKEALLNFINLPILV